MKTKFMMAAVLAAVTASATNYSWKTAVDGEISDSTKWTPQGEPTAEDLLIIGSNPDTLGSTPFTISLSENRTYGSIFTYTGHYTWDLGGHTLSLANWNALLGRSCYPAQWDDWAAITITNGTMNVSDTFQIYPNFGNTGYATVSGPDTVVNAKIFSFGGYQSTMTVSCGAKINTLSTGTDVFFGDRGGYNVIKFTGAGTEYNMDNGLKLGNTAYNADYVGLNQLIVEKGATFNGKGYIYVGHDSGGKGPTEFRIQDGGRFSQKALLNIGTWSSDQRVVVTGTDTAASITNGAIYICDQSATNCQLVVSDHARFDFHTCANGDTDININGCGGGQLIVEDGAEFHIWSRYNGGTIGQYQDVLIGNKTASAGGKDSKLIVRNGALWKAEDRSTTTIGSKAPNCELVVSNATFDTSTTDSNVLMGNIADAINSILRLQGDNAIFKAFTIKFGYAPKIIFEPGTNGFNNIPLELTKNVYYNKGNDYVAPAEEEPELILDVTNWKPSVKGEKTLIQTHRNTYLWEKGTNAMTRLVANAKIIPAKRADQFRIYLTDNLEQVKVAYNGNQGFTFFVR